MDIPSSLLTLPWNDRQNCESVIVFEEKSPGKRSRKTLKCYIASRRAYEGYPGGWGTD